LCSCLPDDFPRRLYGNTAKEAAQEITKTETSFPAGNTETNSQEDTAEEPESTAVQEDTPITAEESQSTAESQTVARSDKTGGR